MSWFLNIFNTTPREEELQSKIYKLEQEKNELEREKNELDDHLEKLNYELAEAEYLAKSWKNSFFILFKNEEKCPK